MSVPPLFPRLKPKSIDPSWFDVDQPCDDEEEVSQLEAQHQAWLQSISQRDSDVTPIGKTICEALDEEDDEEDEDDNDDDEESESHDEEEEDEIEMDVSQERNSPDVINVSDVF
ncbi:hypothetical protein Zmor_001738 [Zophobas morio]|uniref:Uncharacterized protein n=1 Tax=Zophobas morio TaxID=2755281 RepID=A0AA38IZP4_9CUCU|nr:hypothetical protein Zmor_001738 [Zophobas morio]